MADIELVIKIPEEVYKKAQEIPNAQWDAVWLGIKHGTLLPKGHGRLIDADSLKEEMEKDVRRAMSFVDLTDFVWLAPTIIEADREAEEPEI